MSQSEEKYYLNLNIELYNDKNESLGKVNRRIKEDCYLIREDNNKEIKEVKNQSETGGKDLFHVRMTHKNIKLEKPMIRENDFQIEIITNLLSDRIWLIIDSDNNYYELYEDDIIKFGNMKYIVREIFIVKDDDNKEKEIELERIPLFNSIPKIKKYKECKFCQTYNVGLCRCEINDNKKLLHLPCLKKHIELQEKENEEKTIKTYFSNKCFCNKCKTPYPVQFEIEEKKRVYDLIRIEKPNSEAYIILESLGHKYYKENENGYNKIVYMINLDDDKNKNLIKIGRNDKNDIVINDPSVEDEQAELIFDKNKRKIFLKNKSKNHSTYVFKYDLEIKEKVMKVKVNNNIIEANVVIDKK